MQTAIASGGANSAAERLWGVTDTQPDWFAGYLPAASGAPVLNLGAGDGRSARVALARGHKVFLVDETVDDVLDLATGGNAVIVRADIVDRPWPFPPEFFSTMVISRPVPRHTVEAAAVSLRPGGMLIFDFENQEDENVRRLLAPATPGLIMRWLADRFEIVTDRMARSGTYSFVFGPRLVARKRETPMGFEQRMAPLVRNAAQ